MSRTLYVEFRDSGFWVYDVAAEVFAKFLIDAANELAAVSAEQWLADAVAKWRVSAICSDQGFYLDDGWSQPQIRAVIALCRTATEAVRSQGDIPAREVESWQILEDYRIFPRGHDPIPSEAIARFGDAVVQLLEGTLAPAPAGRWWFFTLDNDIRTIAKRSDS
jgi:hypothetical protein